MFAKIAGWVPDADNTSPGVLVDVNDMVPSIRGYEGVPSAIGTALPALAAECRGAAFVIPLDESNALFSGTQTKLYKASSSSWTDVTRVSSDYTGSTSSRWCFTQQGNVTLAVNKIDNSQYYIHGTSTDFADMAEMPKALVCESVGQFILIGNYNNGTDYVDGWGCSAIGDYTDWTADIDTLCTFGRLVDTPGEITGIKRLMEYAIYFKRNSMYLARYVGTPNAWEFSLISDVIGCANNDAVIRVGTVLFFAGPNNFYSFDSASITPIGDTIKEWFARDCNHAYKTKIIGVHDNQRSLVYWFYPSGTSTTLNAWVAYNYRSQQWGKGSLSVEAAAQYVTSAMTYDALDALYTTYGALPSVTYDDLTPSGSSALPAVFNTSHTVQTLTGVSTSSDLTTCDFGEDGIMTLLSRVRARYLKSPATCTLTPYHRRNMGSALTMGTAVTESDGKCDVLQSDRWHRFKMAFTGDVEIVGADITAQADGGE